MGHHSIQVSLSGGMVGAGRRTTRVVPWLVMGVAGLMLFATLQIELSLRTIGAMHVMTTFPLVTALVAARLVRFERSQEEAALDLGASQLQMMVKVVLPQLAPTLAASAIFAFAWSFNNFEISFFTGGYRPDLPGLGVLGAPPLGQPARCQCDVNRYLRCPGLGRLSAVVGCERPRVAAVPPLTFRPWSRRGCADGHDRSEYANTTGCRHAATGKDACSTTRQPLAPGLLSSRCWCCSFCSSSRWCCWH